VTQRFQEKFRTSFFGGGPRSRRGRRNICIGSCWKYLASQVILILQYHLGESREEGEEGEHLQIQ
jgi:hypothetical protein